MRQYKHKTVLLIDDSYIDNLINRKILENNHFAENIVVIDSPKNAIIFMQDRIKDNQNLPEIIFLDLRMPGMSGFDFLKELQSIIGLKDVQVKIYILSSSLDPTDLRKTEENHLVSRFIGKPLTNKILEEI
ncbi:MAG TPA: response regulator [Sphingobacteriaceae bacterium]|nr:response regulator [Sphingobacteriaceae bacterium]